MTQYWLAFAGVLLLATLLFLEGLVVGLALLDPVVSFLNITSYAQPFHVLEAAAWGIFLASAVLAAANFTRALAAERLFPKN
jgi:cbb3-type cytochrome oxidase subunit 1